MGAIKANNYTDKQQDLFATARAFAHPARIRIVEILKQGNEFRNIDFCRELNLSKQSVKNHIQMLDDAGLISINYFIHCYKITLSEKGTSNSKRFFEME